MNDLNKLKNLVGLDISDDLFLRLLFEKNRYFDKEFTKLSKNVQIDNNCILDSIEKKKLRLAYYYGDNFKINAPYKIASISYNQSNIKDVVTDFLNRLNDYDDSLIIESLKQKYSDLKKGVDPDLFSDEWLKIFYNRRSNKLYSFAAIVLDDKLFKKNNYNENIINDFILKTYDNLENYRHLAVVVNGEIHNNNQECITWQLLYKACIYAENFIQFNGDFLQFKKERKINQLCDFLKSRNIANSEKISNEFYQHISTGYRFEDCYISDNQRIKILILKKIELDESQFPCPSCCTTIQRGNSYPEMFLRSYECTNPECPDRSKSGRGKRFTEFSVYRHFKHVENDRNNQITKETYKKWRRDIFDHNSDYFDLLISEYIYSKEKYFIYGNFDEKYKRGYKGRSLINLDLNKLKIVPNALKYYKDLPIVKLFFDINKNKIITHGVKILNKKIEIINDDSTSFLQNIKTNQIGTAITSPPYYNAREYSQWPTMLLYLIDMFINCKVVYSNLKKDSYYLYNIGDIVSEDNVYVDSMMSNRRLPLGYLSCVIFEAAGYNLVGDIIWDKGEVQSKRNSTVDLFSGYVKCINCYEHVFVFKKGELFKKCDNNPTINVERINPVIKINSKGVNTYKHTAPYPIELVDLVKPFIKENSYLLDPFLGSGTTLKWAKLNNKKGVGIEKNKDYFKLCKQNVESIVANEQTKLF